MYSFGSWGSCSASDCLPIYVIGSRLTQRALGLHSKLTAKGLRDLGCTRISAGENGVEVVYAHCLQVARLCRCSASSTETGLAGSSTGGTGGGPVGNQPVELHLAR